VQHLITFKELLKDHLDLKHDTELLEINKTGILPKHVTPQNSTIILAAVGLISAALLTGLIIMGAGIPAVPMIASLETGILEESVLLGPSIEGWLSNVARMIG